MHDGGAVDQPGCRTSKAKAVAPGTAHILEQKVHELEGLDADIAAKIVSLEQRMTGTRSVTSPDQCLKHFEGVQDEYQALADEVDRYDQVCDDLTLGEQYVLHLCQHSRRGMHGLRVWHVFCCGSGQ